MPVPQTEPTLKSYFQTSDQPTQAQFEELIGTMFYQDQENANQAADAVADAAAALALAPVVLLKATRTGGSVSSTSPTYTINSQKNVASITKPSGLRINFTTSLANSNYVAVITPFDTESNFGPEIQIIAQTTTHIEFKFLNTNVANLNPYQLMLVIFAV